MSRGESFSILVLIRIGHGINSGTGVLIECLLIFLGPAGLGHIGALCDSCAIANLLRPLL